MLENIQPPSTVTVGRQRQTPTARQPLGASSHPNTLPVADQTITAKFPSDAQKQSRKLEDRLARTQSRLEEIEADKNQLSRKNEDLATELRLAAQREAKLKASLEKEKANQNKVGGSQAQAALLSKVEELQKIHQEAKEKWRVSIGDVRKELREEKSANDRLKQRMGPLVEEIKAIKLVEEERNRKLKETERKLGEERNKVEGIQFALARAKDELETRQSEDGIMEYLEANTECLVKGALKIAKEREEALFAKQHLQWSLNVAAAQIDLAEQRQYGSNEANELRMAQTELSEYNEFLKDQLIESQTLCNDLQEQMKALYKVMITSTRDMAPDNELPCRCSGRNDTEEANVQESVQLILLEEDVSLLTGRLYQAQSDLETLNDTYVILLRSSKADSDSVARLTSQVAAMKTQIENLEAEKLRVVKERGDLVIKFEQEKLRRTEEEKKRKTVEAEKRNMEENAQRAVRDAAMMREKIRGEEEEKEELLSSLATTSHYQELYTSLLSHSHSLLHRLQASEADLHSLSEENVLLASHSNPTQKILYLDGLRRRLGESREEVGLLKDGESRLKDRVKALESEVRALKGIEGGKGGRVRRIRLSTGRREKRRSSAAQSFQPQTGQEGRRGAIVLRSPRPSLLPDTNASLVFNRPRPARVSLLPRAPPRLPSSPSRGQDGWTSEEEGDELGDSSCDGVVGDKEFTLHELTYGSPRK